MFQPPHRIPLGVDGVGGTSAGVHSGICRKCAASAFLYFGADGRAGGKEKSPRNVNLALKGGVGDHLAVLVNKGKVRDLMVMVSSP